MTEAHEKTVRARALKCGKRVEAGAHDQFFDGKNDGALHLLNEIFSDNAISPLAFALALALEIDFPSLLSRFPPAKVV